MPATQNRPMTTPAINNVVPRSFSSITSPQTAATTNPSGISSRDVWPVRARGADSMLAATATRTSFDSSEGCSVSGPRSIHRTAPFAERPTPGTSTTSSRKMETPRRPSTHGRQRR